ncbi:hypothetical protein [Magnetococcus sp. PR-3]
MLDFIATFFLITTISLLVIVMLDGSLLLLQFLKRYWEDEEQPHE